MDERMGIEYHFGTTAGYDLPPSLLTGRCWRQRTMSAHQSTRLRPTKRCSRCRVWKPLADFHRSAKESQGRQAWCATCMAAYKRDLMNGPERHELLRRAAILERTEPRATKKRANNEAWYHAHRGRVRELEKARIERMSPAQRAVDQHKKRARRLMRTAVETGRMRKPDHCERCPSTGPLHAHHDDYEKPLDVDWLCNACHGVTQRIYI